jgi:PhnB protein
MASPVKRVPQGFHTVTPHLVVRGASEAIEFYKKAFGARELSRAPGPDGKSLMHAEIQIGDSHVFLNDEYPDMGSVSPLALKGTPVTIHLYVEDVDRVFQQAVQAGAKVAMPLADQFWGDRYGIVIDPYGHRWSLASHVKDMTPQEMQKAAAEAFAQMGAPKKK